mmetsp:Transcript_41866/g.164133  ORF Transcript_41866/g.164133 Transcript_41866/m.164133 type:complete len:154 (+) Transcript_41866:330-791(+)|eukprot:CAMPEP_0113966462 /NCGR_PEP_ID=MMETSP0011_2-20120614/8341_1 /TAXON_ID=101924 /ORGANISM="Rhodosorus marinus" /LENGTH=153 /DNA_ID=CAMNT_0000979143 /DNA_START=261 /DNA_END=722 /DNA_ORIENTATION=+ /assembly_acc=CAM_ASM_000156
MESLACGFIPGILGIPVQGSTAQKSRIERSRWRVVKRRSEQSTSQEDAWKFQIPEGYEDAMRLEGEPGCESCAGNGSITCAPCMGTGVISVEMFGKTSSCTCHLCGGRKTIPCPVCKRMIYRSVVWWKDFQKKKDEAGVAQVNGGKAPDETDG